MATNLAPSGVLGESRDVDLAAEVERLRFILDKQPSCLLRVALDGTLLAVNDAALSLLGARKLAQVLDTNLMERLGDESPTSVWADFVERVSRGSSSVECEMVDLAGSRRAVILQGIVLGNHPDAVPSLLVSVRDVSTSRRLEESLEEQEQLRRSVLPAIHDASATLQQMRQQLDAALAERRELRAALETTVTQREQIAASLKQLTTSLNALIEAAALAQILLNKGDVK